MIIILEINRTVDINRSDVQSRIISIEIDVLIKLIRINLIYINILLYIKCKPNISVNIEERAIEDIK